MPRENDEHLLQPNPTAGSFEEVEDTGRLLALSDGVFAFAMTLLVINLAIPSTLALSSPPYAGLPTSVALSRYLVAEWTLFSSYVTAFLVIAVWWTIHRRIFRFIRGVDALLNWTNIAFLLLIGITPFVTGLDGLYGASGIAVALYSAVQCGAGITIGLIALHVSTRVELAHPAGDSILLRRTAETAFMIAAIFSVTASVAQYAPGDAQYLYFAIILVSIRSGALSHRLRRGHPKHPAPLMAPPSERSLS